MTYQIDFGNLAVGIGTAIVAFVSFVISQQNIQQLKRQKVADFRMKWIDEFRVELSNLVEVYSEIISIRRRKESDKNSDVHSQRLSELQMQAVGLRSRLLLRLKPDTMDVEEAELEGLLRNAMEIDPDKANDQRKKIVSLSRSLLKREWDRVKKEIETSIAA